MATLKDTIINDTGYLKSASGTTAQRPGCASAGMTRYNTDEGYHEWYNGTFWQRVGLNARYVTATGGTITTCGDYKIHTFTSSGTFTVTCAGNPEGGSTVDYLVIGGGAGGGAGNPGETGGAGGGAGGYRESVPSPAAWTASPLANPGNQITVTATGYPVTVGGGGNGAPGSAIRGTPGSPSVFSTITSAGGGGGAGVWDHPPSRDGIPGASGGGAAYGRPAGSGNQPPVSPPQGNPGGTRSPGRGGGGGAGAAAGPSGNGGAGSPSEFSGTDVTRAGGGAGTGTATGGGGSCVCGVGQCGTANTGGGGGGTAVTPSVGGSGGSGVVIIRYKFK